MGIASLFAAPAATAAAKTAMTDRPVCMPFPRCSVCPHYLAACAKRAEPTLAMRIGQQTVLVPHSAVKALIADSKYVRVVYAGRRGDACGDFTLKALAAQFPHFMRVSRGALVNPVYVESVRHRSADQASRTCYGDSGLFIRLRGETETIGVTRRQGPALRQWLRAGGHGSVPADLAA